MQKILFEEVSLFVLFNGIITRWKSAKARNATSFIYFNRRSSNKTRPSLIFLVLRKTMSKCLLLFEG